LFKRARIATSEREERVNLERANYVVQVMRCGLIQLPGSLCTRRRASLRSGFTYQVAYAFPPCQSAISRYLRFYRTTIDLCTPHDTIE